jgi:hypothetical protein
MYMLHGTVEEQMRNMCMLNGDIFSHSITYKQHRYYACTVSNSGDMGEKSKLIVLHDGRTVGPPIKGYRCRATLPRGAQAHA